MWHWPGCSLWLTSDIEVSHWWTKKQENWPHTFKSSDCPWQTANSSDTYHHRRFTAKTIGYTHSVRDLGGQTFLLHFPQVIKNKTKQKKISNNIHVFIKCTSKLLTTAIHCWLSCQCQVTLFTNSLVILVCRVRACVSVALGARQVPLLCSWAGLMRYQTQTSIHQPHWWGQWGATASVKRGIMAPRVGIGQPCLQRLLGTEGLKQYTTAASTLLCSVRSSSLTLGAASQDFFLSLWFSGTKTQKKKCTSGIWRPNF